jgi:predicted metal-binding protein
MLLRHNDLVLEPTVRRLCREPYPGHPKGCPNWGKKDGCPPRARLLENVFDLKAPVYLVHNRFCLAEHVNKLRAKHPTWSDRQLRCCLYWQGTARKQLRQKVSETLCEMIQFSDFGPGDDPVVLYCPEACGVNVSRTMRRMGIRLEWPPMSFAYQVALIGHRR